MYLGWFIIGMIPLANQHSNGAGVWMSAVDGTNELTSPQARKLPHFGYDSIY
jgi:hypothetical protein